MSAHNRNPEAISMVMFVSPDFFSLLGCSSTNSILIPANIDDEKLTETLKRYQREGKTSNAEIKDLLKHELDYDLRPGTLEARIAFDQGIHIPRHQVRDIMRLHETEDFERRTPGSKRIHRTPVVALGMA
jgi:hypothetical protein